jgi:hypothetical protein
MASPSGQQAIKLLQFTLGVADPPQPTCVRNGRGRETAQTPAQGLLFRQEHCGGGLQQEN